MPEEETSILRVLEVSASICFTYRLLLFSQVTHIKAPKTAEDEFIEIQSSTGTPVQRWAVRSLTLCKLVRRDLNWSSKLH